MGPWTIAGRRGRSSDFAYTWVGIPTLPFGGFYAYAYAGGIGVASRWIAVLGIVRYSPDWGSTWINKEGNMLSITPIINLDIVIVVGL